ncbi:unnamed protein product [Phytophthora fragariaefolia]|uniref:Unnamed protein product n=1 Tax=Phytophthora fragariaefolia TaxID=1490495 RepID=A0A9W6U1H8_9STRA|nr:unnamed protein product [Phytophthora fragariaefolia]
MKKTDAGNEQPANEAGTVLLRDVLFLNDEPQLYDEILELARHTEDEPPVIFGWKHVQEFVEAIITANVQADEGGGHVPDPPFPLPNLLTGESFKRALLAYANVMRVPPLGTTCLPGQSPAEATWALQKLCELDFHPWTQHIIAVGGADSVLPVAGVYIPRLGTNVLKVAITPRPHGMWNTL